MENLQPAGSGSEAALRKEVAALLREARSPAAFTGAGISTSAGIADFRGKKGIYTTGAYPPEVFDLAAFRRDPSVFYRYARDFAAMEERLSPTFTHRFLARLEKTGKLKWVITQNIDGLHQKAGSRHVLEVHGSYARSYCLHCGREYPYAQLKEKMAREDVPRCDACAGVVKPDIVFFGEAVKDFDEAQQIAAGCDVLLVIGTTLTVYPAAALPELVKGSVVFVNRGDARVSGPRAMNVDADIDGFFRGVAAELGEE